MPTVDNFQHIGHFPFCLPQVGTKINVNNVGGGALYDYKYIEESDTAGMAALRKLFWDVHSVEGSASIDAAAVSNPVYDVFAATSGELEPSERVCLDQYLLSFSERAGTHPNRPYFQSELNLHRLYDGDVNNEANFLGYALDDGVSTRSALIWADAIADIDPNPDDLSDSEIIWFSMLLRNNSIATSGNYTITETNLAGIPVFRGTFSDHSGGNTASVSVTGFQFYDYE